MSLETSERSPVDEPEIYKPREKCGVVGIYGQTANIAHKTYDALYELQHRGEQAAGISVLGESVVTSKRTGKVSAVFGEGNLEGLPEGRIGVGHVRYQTVEVDSTERDDAIQPLYNPDFGFVVAHNGNLTHVDGEPFEPHGQSDTAALSDIVADELACVGTLLPEAAARAARRVEGAYSLVIADRDHLIAMRDPRGFRPLVYGRMSDGTYVAASESVALDALDVRTYQNLDAGHMLIVNETGAQVSSFVAQPEKGAFCMMELVYFSRPDSMYGSKSVHTMRVRSGAQLAREAPADVDIVIGVPGTGLDAAKGYAEALDLPYSDKGLHKTGYERSFIAATDEERRDIARRKFNVTRDIVAGKRVAVIDDSLIRGTVTSVIVEKLKNFGAKEVHFRVASPPYRYACHYGIDTGNEAELIARSMNEDEIASYIGVNSLKYLSLDGLKHALRFIEEQLCDACVSGHYPAPLKIGSFAASR